MATAHQIARKLLALPDYTLLDEYAENEIVDVKTSTYDDNNGTQDCIMYVTDDFIPDDETGEPEDEDPGEGEE